MSGQDRLRLGRSDRAEPVREALGAGDQPVSGGRRQRPGEQVALPFHTSQGSEQGTLTFMLDPLGDDFEPESLPISTAARRIAADRGWLARAKKPRSSLIASSG